MTFFTGLCFLAAALLVSFQVVQASVTCKFDGDGVPQLVLEGSDTANKPFNCVEVNKMIPAKSVHAPLDAVKSCEVSIGVEKKKTSYKRTDMFTGDMCVYKCGGSPKDFYCTGPTSGGKCPCKLAGEKLLVTRYNPSVSGQSEASNFGSMTLGGQSDFSAYPGDDGSCDGKEEGHQFHDDQGCVSIKADVTKYRVTPLREGECSAVETRSSETRYMPSDPNDMNLQGCMHVCKKAGFTCQGPVKDETCPCNSSGLAKRLVPLSEMQFTSRVIQQECKSDTCGACGVCNQQTLQCELSKKSMGNVCPCGERCPTHEQAKQRRNQAGALDCQPNMALECRPVQPSFLSGLFGAPTARGTSRPDYCYCGKKSDLGDHCGCAPGYSIRHPIFSLSRCVADPEVKPHTAEPYMEPVTIPSVELESEFSEPGHDNEKQAIEREVEWGRLRRGEDSKIANGVPVPI